MAFSVDYMYRIIDKFSGPMNQMANTSKKFSDKIGPAWDKTRKFGKSIVNIGKVASVAAIAGLVALSKKSSDLWDIQLAAIKSVEATLKSTEGTVGRTLNQLEKQASSLQQNTFFGDEAILQGVTAQMLTFTNITGDSFDRAQKVVLDVTSKLRGLNATQGDLQSTTIMLSKALNDPVANLGALSRAGIQFSEDQKKLIKQLAKTGRMSDAQNIVLSELEKQYGGTAEALTKTAKGYELQTKNMIGDSMELIGKGLAPLRVQFLQFVQKILPQINAQIPKLVKFIQNFTKAVVPVAKILFSIIKILIPFVPIILGIIAAWKAYQAILIIATAAQWLMNIALSANPVGVVILAIGALIGVMVTLILYSEKVQKKFQELSDNTWIVLLLTYFNPLLVVLLEVLAHIDDIKKAFQDEGLVGGIKAIGKALLSAFLLPLQKIMELIGKIPGADWARDIAKSYEDFRGGLFDDSPKLETQTGTNTMNATMNLNVRKEKGVTVEPYSPTGNMGFNMVGEY